MGVRERLAEETGEDLLFLTEPQYDRAIIGLGRRLGMETCVVYDRDIIIEVLTAAMRAEAQETPVDPHEMAEEFFDFNIAGAYLGPKTPIYVTRVALTE